MAQDQGEDKKGAKKGRRINIGARTGMIAYVVALSATAGIAIYSYMQEDSLIWWLIIVIGSFALFLLIGSILQTIVEIQVEKIMIKEAEERKLREIAAKNGEYYGSVGLASDTENDTAAKETAINR